MAKKDRMGARVKRDQKKPFKMPAMEYYLIVTDTEATERHYFEGLRRNLPQDVQEKICLKVCHVKTAELVEKCKSLAAYKAQYCKRWIVFDRDRVRKFDEIIDEAKSCGISVGWSNPCFEIWLFAYFGEMPTLTESQQCCSEFGHVYKRKTGQQYKKSDIKLYEKIFENGDEERALRRARQRLEQHRREMKKQPSEMCPATTVHELVGKIRGNG